MKKFLLVLLSFIVFSSISSAQWTQTNGPKGGAVGKILKLHEHAYAYSNSSDIYLSQDDCKTWKIVFTLQKQGEYNPCIFTIHNFNKRLYVGCNYGLYISDEKLLTFEQLKNTNIKGMIFHITSNDSAVYVASYVESELSEMLFMSTISDNTWKNITNDTTGYEKGFSINVAIKWGKIYLSTLGYKMGEEWIGPGMQVSSNGGKTWRTIKTGLTNTAITNIGFNDNLILIGSDECGMFISNDFGENWQTLTAETLPGNHLVTDIQSNSQYIFVVLKNQGVYRSSDNGSTWKLVDKGIVNKKIFNLCINGSEIYAGSEFGLFKSTDNGDNWIEYNDGIIACPITAMVNNEQSIFATTRLFGFNKTTDNGETWEKINLSPSLTYADKIAIKGDTIVTGRYATNDTYKSIDNGNSWESLKTEGLNKYIRFLHISNSYIFVAGDQGLFRSSNNGNDWEPVLYNSSALIYINSIISENGDLFISDYNKGILKSTDEGTTWMQLNYGSAKNKINSLDVEGNKILCCSLSGNVYFSQDRGENWSLIQSTPQKYQIACGLIIDNKIFIGTKGDGDTLFGSGVKLSVNYGLTWMDVSQGFKENMGINSLKVLGEFIFAGTENYSVYKAKISDFDYVGVEDEKPISNFIIASPPYPLPSKQIVNTLINWSAEIDIANADMAVYNSLGEKVCGKEQIIFQQRSPNSGIVTWNAEDNPLGVYFLHISTANEKKVISFVIE